MGVRAVRVALPAAVVACWALGALPVEAQTRRPIPQLQTRPTPRAGSWEVSGSYLFVSGYDLGTANADLTRNTTTGSGTFTQFVADSSIEPAHALVGRLAYYFSPRLAVEGGVRFGRPVYLVRLSGDSEEAPDVSAEETLHQYVFDASVLWHFSRASLTRSRMVPFVYGGGGYLRELHENQQLIETGTEYHAGAGLKYWFGTGRRRFGLRGEGGLSFRDGGFDFEENVRIVPTVGAALIYLF
jgi:hypothetical protein